VVFERVSSSGSASLTRLILRKVCSEMRSGSNWGESAL